MQIQSVQSTKLNNNSFKAYFVNDSKGYLRRVWENAEKNDVLEKQIKRFSENQTEHKLEIIGLLGEDLVGRFKGFEIFNHRTGVSANFTSDTHENLLGKFLDDVFNNGKSKYLFHEYKNAKMFQKLTGQK